MMNNDTQHHASNFGHAQGLAEQAQTSMQDAHDKQPLNFGNKTEEMVNNGEGNHGTMIGYGSNQLSGDDKNSDGTFGDYTGIFDNHK